MAVSLENYSPEIVESIVVLLDLNDIRNLRLCSRSLAAKCSQHHLKRFFRRKHIELTREELGLFANGIQAGGLRHLLQDLTITGIANEEYTAPNKAPGDPRLLSRAFQELASTNRDKSPSLLSLRVAVATKNEERIPPAKSIGMFVWKRVWQSTADTFITAFQALAASSLPIECLNIFNGSEQQRCSLASDQLNKINWSDAGLARSLASVQSLSISLSCRALEFYEDEDEQEYNWENDILEDNETEPPERDRDELRAEAEDDDNFTGLAKLLKLLGQLQTFELHYLHIHNVLPIDSQDERLFQHVAGLANLPTLKWCRLRGIIVREEHLLAFIKGTSVNELLLETVKLRSGTFRSIFEYCTSDEASITKLYFDALTEGNNGMVHFIGPGCSRIGFDPLTMGSEMLERQGNEVKQPIIYHFPNMGPWGAPMMAEWRRYQRLEYMSLP